MANIGMTDIYIPVPLLPKDDFRDYSTKLFDEWESYVEKSLLLPDYSLSLHVEEGSIKVIGRVAAALGILYIGIGQYGSFFSGLSTIEGQVQTVGGYLSKRASTPFDDKGVKPKVRKKGEALSRLKTLFVKVQTGKLTVDQAMTEAENLFGAEAQNSPDFMKALKNSLDDAPPIPEQMQIPLVGSDEEELSLPSNKRSPPPKKPKQPIAARDRYRIELWKDNKRGERNIKIVSF